MSHILNDTKLDLLLAQETRPQLCNFIIRWHLIKMSSYVITSRLFSDNKKSSSVYYNWKNLIICSSKIHRKYFSNRFYSYNLYSIMSIINPCMNDRIISNIYSRIHPNTLRLITVFPFHYLDLSYSNSDRTTYLMNIIF